MTAPRGPRIARLLPALRFAATRVSAPPRQWWTCAAAYAMSAERAAPVQFFVGSEAMETVAGVALSLRENLGKDGNFFRVNLAPAQARELALRLLEDANESEAMNTRQALKAARG